jgi:hypothetical protein
MSVLGSVYRARHELDNSLAAHLRALTGAKLRRSLEAGTARGVDFSAGSEESGLVAASTVLQGVNALASALSEKLAVPEVPPPDPNPSSLISFNCYSSDLTSFLARCMC